MQLNASAAFAVLNRHRKIPPATENRPEVKPQPHFGVSEVKGVQYIFQDTCPEGMPLVAWEDRFSKRSGHSTEEAGIGGGCSHNLNTINLYRKVSSNQWAEFLKIARDPLVQLFMPVPAVAKPFQSNVLILDQNLCKSWYFLLKNLERLCSPMYTKIWPWGDQQAQDRYRELSLTNIHPVVYTFKAAKHDFNEIRQFISAARNSDVRRPVLLVADTPLVAKLAEIKGTEVIQSGLVDNCLTSNMITLPLEHIGTRVLGYYAQHDTIELR